MDTKSVEKQALGLPAPNRAKLARKLLESRNTLSAAEREQLWLDEAARRAGEIESGQVQCVPAEEVFRKLDVLLT